MGRCGSVTFANAAQHNTNATAGHESRSHLLGADRFLYEAHHIEVDNRLSWMLGRLDQAFGRQVFYIHLTRQPDTVAASFAARYDRGVMQAYAQGILMNGMNRKSDAVPLDFGYDYVATVTANITHFLCDKPHQMTFQLEKAAQEMSWFWQAIGAEGDLEAAKAEWQVKHNAHT